MSKIPGKLANRYAKALLKAMTEEQEGEGSEQRSNPASPSAAQLTAAELRSFCNLWQQEKDLAKNLMNPFYQKDERQNALLEIVKRAGFSSLAQRFIGIVFQRDRLGGIAEIVKAFSELADKEAGVLRVQITSARAISDAERQEIKTRLLAQIKAQLEFSWDEDGSLIGGIVVRYQGKVLDASIKGRLERMEQSLAL